MTSTPMSHRHAVAVEPDSLGSLDSYFGQAVSYLKGGEPKQLTEAGDWSCHSPVFNNAGDSLYCTYKAENLEALEKNITEFIWKVLGTTGRDEKEREQFFVFLKEVVREEGSLTEESVSFIFFDILMSLVAGWFSLRVYDCL